MHHTGYKIAGEYNLIYLFYLFWYGGGVVFGLGIKVRLVALGRVGSWYGVEGKVGGVRC